MWRRMRQWQHLEGPKRHPRRVLLVTADPTVRDLVSTFLWSMGCSCVIAASAAEFDNVERTSFDAVVIDGSDSAIHAEQAITRIRELHPTLAERILVLTSGLTGPELFELVERHGLRQMSQQVLMQQLWMTLQEIFAGPRMARLTPRNTQVTQLIFDRLHAPLPDGVHSLPATGRELAYKHKDTIIDIVIEPIEKSGRVSLAGHVVGAKIRRDKNRGLPVLLTDRMKTLARTRTNKFGEFNLEFDLVEDANIQIQSGEGSWASIPLGKMNWVKKPFAN
jgi:CheY-like chemotaxis protein